MPNCDCETAIGKSWLISGYRQDGERVDCPACGKTWVHVCDEAEGCSWLAVVICEEPASDPTSPHERGCKVKRCNLLGVCQYPDHCPPSAQPTSCTCTRRETSDADGNEWIVRDENPDCPIHGAVSEDVVA